MTAQPHSPDNVAAIRELAGKIPALSKAPGLSDINAIITLMDGTVLTALPQMAWASVKA